MNISGNEVKLQIWDTAGQERFRTITSAYYKGAHGIIMVYDLTSESSFNDITEFWAGEVVIFSSRSRNMESRTLSSPLPGINATRKRGSSTTNLSSSTAKRRATSMRRSVPRQGTMSRSYSNNWLSVSPKCILRLKRKRLPRMRSWLRCCRRRMSLN